MAQLGHGRVQPQSGQPHHVMWDKALDAALASLQTQSSPYTVQVQQEVEISPNPGRIQAYVVNLNSVP
jgi:hypothetical protein